MQSNQNPLFQPAKKKPAATNHQSFIEALKSIGGSTAQSIKKDLIQGTAQDAWNSVTGNYPSADNRYNSMSNMGGYNQEWMQQREEEIRAQERARQRHREILEAQPVFDRHKEEAEKKIKEIRDELKLLALELGTLSSDIQRAIEEEVVNPGVYHVSFFEKLRGFLANLRKQVNDSQNWMAISSQRKQAKNVYWGNFKKQGTKYSMSQERTLATSAG